jgi:hypothetical protein
LLTGAVHRTTIRVRMSDHSAPLDGWKAIASYLRRDVRTVQRWEKPEGLPIHRHAHAKLGSAFAFSAELEDWLRARDQSHPVR